MRIQITPLSDSAAPSGATPLSIEITCSALATVDPKTSIKLRLDDGARTIRISRDALRAALDATAADTEED